MKTELAFPLYEMEQAGLTKREYYAAIAMQGLLSAIYTNKEMINEFMKRETGQDSVSRNAVGYADALIKELEKE